MFGTGGIWRLIQTSRVLKGLALKGLILTGFEDVGLLAIRNSSLKSFVLQGKRKEKRSPLFC
jgi:hypothetical protein